MEVESLVGSERDEVQAGGPTVQVPCDATGGIGELFVDEIISGTEGERPVL